MVFFIIESMAIEHPVIQARSFSKIKCSHYPSLGVEENKGHKDLQVIVRGVLEQLKGSEEIKRESEMEGTIKDLGANLQKFWKDKKTEIDVVLSDISAVANKKVLI